jgi:uncharacterized protein (TIGR01777 family)
VKWDPETGELGGTAAGAEAVVHLAGASIAEGRWTPERKALLRSSRVEGTRSLVNALAKMAAKPRVLVSASAIGYYGNRGEEVLDESCAPGNDFLSGVAKAWEAEAEKAGALGIRVVQARFGMILSQEGGALPKMARPFRFGVGGRIATGQQWMSWITLRDALAIVRLALEDERVRGPVNVVSPQPVQNVGFTKVLASSLGRPAWFPAPAFALRLALGEMADALLLSSQRVVPRELGRLGYKFLHPDLAAILPSLVS